MVPVGTSAGKSADSTLAPVKDETATMVSSSGVAPTDSELLGTLQKQPSSWVSSPEGLEQ